MSGECDECSEHAVDCKCLTDNIPNLGLNRMLLETPMPDTILKRFSLEIQKSNECPACFDEHPKDVACNPWRRKHPMTEDKMIISDGPIAFYKGNLMEWINVKDKLPEETDCIVYGTPTCGGACGNKPIITQARHKEGEEFEFGEYDCGIEVTHWMPFPKIPES